MYGNKVQQLAALIEDKAPVDGDLSFKAAIFTALAWLAIQKIYNEHGVEQFMSAKRPLVTIFLERAWRDILELRSRQDPGTLDKSFMSQFGRFYAADIPDSVIQGLSGVPESLDFSTERDSRPGPTIRNRRRRTRKSYRSKT